MSKKLLALFFTAIFVLSASASFALDPCEVDCEKLKLYDPYHVDIQKCYPPAQGQDYDILECFDYEAKGNPWCDGVQVEGIPYNLCRCADCYTQSGNFKYVSDWGQELALRIQIKVQDKDGMAKDGVYWSEVNKSIDLLNTVRIKSFFSPEGWDKDNNAIYCDWYAQGVYQIYAKDVDVAFYASDVIDTDGENPGEGEYWVKRTQQPYLAAAFPCYYYCNLAPEADYLYTTPFFLYDLVGAQSAADAQAMTGQAYAPNFLWLDIPSMVYDAAKAAFGDQVSVDITFVRPPDDPCELCPWVLVCECAKPVAILGCPAHGCAACLPYLDATEGAFTIANISGTTGLGTVTFTGSGASVMTDFEVPAMTVKTFQMADFADVLGAAGIDTTQPVFAQVTTEFQSEVFAMNAGLTSGFGYLPIEGNCGCALPEDHPTVQ